MEILFFVFRVDIIFVKLFSKIRIKSNLKMNLLQKNISPFQIKWVFNIMIKFLKLTEK